MKDKKLKELLLSIKNSDLNAAKPGLFNHGFELSLHPLLTLDLSGWIGALIVRAILFELKIDEHHLFKWRPENKYIQYLILNHYSPGCMPRTLSLTAVLHQNDWVPKIRSLIKSGYFIKATLGFGSGRTQNFDRTSEFGQILSDHQPDHSFQHEKWMIQKRLDLHKEFRIHTFGRDILYGLTLRISGVVGLTDFDQPQEFISVILKKLPAALIEGTLIGWDIGLTKNGKYKVIEANFTGFHPEYHAGFQTTGYVDDPPFGSIVCAWLHAYFKNKYDVSITSIDHVLMEKFPHIEEFSYYLSILKNEHVDAMIKGKGRLDAVFVFLDQQTDYHMINLITFMIITNFANHYYMITCQGLQEEAKKIFAGDQITHLSEQSFFTEDENNKLQQLDDESKNELRIHHAIRLSGGVSYIII